MKAQFLTALLTLLCLSACIYDAPLVDEAALPIDPALLGNWEFLPDDPSDQSTPERLVISQDGANLYEIQHISEHSTIYFKGWLAELEGIRFVQTEVTGDDDGPVTAEDTNLFSVYSYVLENGELVVKTLNTDFLPPDLDTSQAMREAFATHHDDPALFDGPGRLKRL